MFPSHSLYFNNAICNVKTKVLYNIRQHPSLINVNSIIQTDDTTKNKMKLWGNSDVSVMNILRLRHSPLFLSSALEIKMHHVQQLPMISQS